MCVGQVSVPVHWYTKCGYTVSPVLGDVVTWFLSQSCACVLSQISIASRSSSPPPPPTVKVVCFSLLFSSDSVTSLLLSAIPFSVCVPLVAVHGPYICA